MNSAEILHFQEYFGGQVNPQVEDGHVKIANDLFETIMGFSFTKQQLKIVLAVIRKTYGYQKKADDISLSQLCELTHLYKPDVSVALKQLAAMNVLKVEDGKFAKRIEFNKHYDQWKEKSVSESLTGERITNEGLVKHEPQKTIPKDNVQKEKNTRVSDVEKVTQQEAFERFYKAYPKKKKRPDAQRAWNKLQVDRDLYQTIMDALDAHKQSHDWLKDDGEFIPYPATWLNGKCWEDSLRVEVVQTFTPSQQALVDLYNDKCGSKFAPLLEFHPDRAAHIDRMLEKKPLDTWGRYFDYMVQRFDPAKLDSLPGFEFVTSAKTYNAAVEGRI